MHWGTTVHGYDLSGQPGSLRQVRRRHLQHESAVLPQFGHLLPGGLGILLPMSGGGEGRHDGAVHRGAVGG